MAKALQTNWGPNFLKQTTTTTTNPILYLFSLMLQILNLVHNLDCFFKVFQVLTISHAKYHVKQYMWTGSRNPCKILQLHNTMTLLTIAAEFVAFVSVNCLTIFSR